MLRCNHIYDSGFQCEAEALGNTSLCGVHQKVVAVESLDGPRWRKLILRFVALILLIMFLLPIAYTLKNLYLVPPPKAQEVW